MENTTILSESEYQGIPFDLQEQIQRHVNNEEKRWYNTERISPPAFTRPKVAPITAGVYNLVRQFLP